MKNKKIFRIGNDFYKVTAGGCPDCAFRKDDCTLAIVMKCPCQDGECLKQCKPNCCPMCEAGIDWDYPSYTDYLCGTQARKEGQFNSQSDICKVISNLKEEKEQMAAEIRKTWAAAQGKGQLESFRIIERMVYRLGYGTTKDNPSLAE
jgi:hypothetical protein